MKKSVVHLLWVYLFSWLLSFLLIVFQLLTRERSFGESISFFMEEVVPNRTFLMAQHIFFVLLYLLFLSFRYFSKTYKNYGTKVMFKKLGLYFILPITVLLATYKTLVFANTSEASSYVWHETAMNTDGKVNRYFEIDQKQRGMSVFGWDEDNTQAITDLVHANVEWVAVTPFIYQEDENSLEIGSKRDNNQFTKRDSVFINTIKELRSRGLYVHLKPHLWLGQGWRSNLTHSSSEAWATWFGSYRSSILHYAKMAELTEAELFCVGTELKTSIKNQPEAWHKLIQDIRKIYKGKLTYAANWHDEYEHVTFWDALDYIGIQAYFPLTKTKNPDLETIKSGWQPHLKKMEAFSERHQKPILFTEVGYRSEASATIKPWEWSSAFEVLFNKKSDRTQYLAYEAVFLEVWHQDWLAGVYLWQWDTRSSEASASQNLDFSPRFKPAENVMAQWFGKVVQEPGP